MAAPSKPQAKTKSAGRPKPARPLTAEERARLAKAQSLVQQLENGQTSIAEAFGFSATDQAEFVQVARAAYQSNDFAGAADAALVALAINDSDTDAWLLMGLSLAQRRRSSAAREALNQLLKLKPDHLEGWVHLAEVELADMKAEAAAAALKKAIELDPKALTPHGLRAQILVVEALSKE